MNRFPTNILAAGIILGASTTSLPAQERDEVITFIFQSEYPYVVNIRFYSQNYDAIWPSENKSWVIDDWETHEYGLSCVYGEKISWGAWAEGDNLTYWGAGNSNLSCSGCAYICGDKNPEVLTIQTR